jgi:hypothetical protein
MKRIIFISFMSSFLILSASYVAASDSVSDTSGNTGTNTAGIFHDLYLLPGARLKYDAARYFHNTMGFTAETTGSIDIDFARFRRFSFSFLMRERNIYGGRGLSWYTPWTIQYIPVEMAHIKWDSGYGYLGFIVDHECYNAINRDVPELKRYRWYGVALKWQSYGIDPDAHNYPREFSFIGKPEYALYIGRRLKTVAYPYKYMVQWDLRYDIMRLLNIVPYIKTSGSLIIDSRARVNRSFEIGSLCLFDPVIVSPYFRYSYRHDIDRYEGTAAHFWTIGTSAETKITGIVPTNESGHDQGTRPVFAVFPEMHFTGSYGRHYRNRIIGNDAYSDISLTVLSFSYVSAYIENELNHNSPHPRYYMFPKYIDYSNKAGLSSCPISDIAVVSVEYSFNQKHIGDYTNIYPEKHHAAEFRIESPGMHRNTKYTYIKKISSSDGLIKDLQWGLDIQRNFNVKNYPYTWQIHGALEWDIFSFAGLVPYISPDITFLRGTRKDMNWSVETGIHFCREITTSLFCRYEDQALFSGNSRIREKSVYCGIRFSR